MKSTDTFKKTIKDHLDLKAQTDVLFAETYKKEGKNIDDCVTYIFNQVKASGCNGFTDDEIFGMAIHYYDEDKITIGSKSVNSNVVVNHKVVLSDEEKAEARKQAVEQEINKARSEMHKPKKTKPEVVKLRIRRNQSSFKLHYSSHEAKDTITDRGR